MEDGVDEGRVVLLARASVNMSGLRIWYDNRDGLSYGHRPGWGFGIDRIHKQSSLA